MAATVTDIGTGNTGSLTDVVSTGATITGTTADGDWFVVLLSTTAHATDPPYASVTDTAGNTYTSRVNFDYSPSGTSGEGAGLAIFTAPVTSNITNGTITAHRSYLATYNQVIQVYRVRPPAGGTISFVTANNPGSGSSTTSHSAATVSVAAGDLIFGAAALETNDPITGDSDTTNGSWSAVLTRLRDSGTDSSSNTLPSQYKTTTALGNQSWTCSTTSSRPSCRSYLVLHSTGTEYSLAAAQGQYTLSGTAATMRLGNAPIVAGVGSYALTGTAATPRLAKAVVAAAGSYSLAGTDANTLHGWKVAADAGSYALTGTDAVPFKTAVAGKTLPAASGSYVLTGSDATPLHLGANVVAGTGSYVLTGTDATLHRGYRIAAGDETIPGVGDLLLETGDFLLFETGDFLLLEEAASVIAGGVYALTGNTVNLNASTGNKTASVDPGSYALTGTTASVLHGWRIGAGDPVLEELLDEFGAPILDELGNPIYLEQDQPGGGSYALTGTDAALTASVVAHLTIVAESGSYLLTGTDVALRSSAQPAVSPLHIGEWPVDKRRRRRREDAVAAEQRARKRFRDAIGRLLEGQPPEFDEPADLDEALDSAVQASNLLYALSAPIREINVVNELIDHIRQLRIAQPIAQLHLAQAYNQAHRHLRAKAQEDTVMALLLGE